MCVSLKHYLFLLSCDFVLQNTSRLPVMSGKRAHTNSTDGEQQQPAQVCFSSFRFPYFAYAIVQSLKDLHTSTHHVFLNMLILKT